MPAFTATACGKIILFGEHAVVYGRPAIAIPLRQVKARAVIEPNPLGMPGEMHLQAPDINLDAAFSQLASDHPLAAAVQQVLIALNVSRLPACKLRVTSTIPVASGLGSGAAVSVAVIRALSAYLGRPLPDDQVSALAYEVEKLHHGSPSGIDNTVITYNKPVYFVRGQPMQTFKIARPFILVIGDTGVSSPTARAVTAVRQGWQAEKELFESYFDALGSLVDSARQAIENGQVESLGILMDANHSILRKIGVSSPELDRLIGAARKVGAWGAKLSGSGLGGNMIALASSPENAETVMLALKQAGAVRAIAARVG